MPRTYTISFFGDRKIEDFKRAERRVKPIINEIIQDTLYAHEFVEFLVGRNGDFDRIVASVIKETRQTFSTVNSSLILVLPYETAEYTKNREYIENYYDSVEICPESSKVTYNSAVQVRNRQMVDRSQLIFFHIENDSVEAYKAVQYAKKQSKPVVDIIFQNAPCRFN